jgi:ribosomal protein L16 Arg81 hydroxylase
MFGLKYLLSPVRLDEFWDTCWGVKALHVPGDPEKFPDLFGWEALRGLLNEGQTGPDSIRLVHDKKPIPPQEAVHVSKWLKQGATLIVDHLHRSDPVVGRLTDALARELNTVVNTNCYSSWPVSQGFDLHYDGHDVFVINLEGRKAWKVCEPTFRHPLERHARHRGPTPEDAVPYLECTLDVGDVLYIPRGHWHSALAVTPSMHLTIGPQPRSKSEFLAWLAGQLGNTDEAFRTDFSIARAAELGGDGDPDLLRQEVEEFRDRLSLILEPDSLRESLLRFIMQGNSVRRFYQLPDLPRFGDLLDENTRLVIAPAQKVVLRQSRSGDTVLMLARGAEMAFRGLPIESLRQMLDEQGPWTPREMMDRIAGLEWTPLKALLETWFDHGIVRLHEE